MEEIDQELLSEMFDKTEQEIDTAKKKTFILKGAAHIQGYTSAIKALKKTYIFDHKWLKEKV